MKSESGSPAAGPDRRAFLCAEAARWLVLLAATIWLVHPYFAARLIGTGDALWYHHSLADAVTQFRAGVFPVFVGQSDYSFNGSIYPLRAAPYYQYLAGLLDLLTGRTLGFFALEHLTAIVSVLTGAATAYWALVWIAPGQRWSAAALALLYVMCPGVAGLFYAQDLYMSGMALPWVPLAFAALVRSFDDDSLGPQAVLAASLAALWWAHSPIALWATAFAAVGEVVRLIDRRLSRLGFARAAIGAGIFAALAAYPFVSVFLLRTPGEAIVPYIMDRQALLEVVRKSFPSSLQPIDLNAPILTYMQLGYGLWLVLLAGGIAWCFRPRLWAVALLLASAALMVLLLFPFPWINRALWLSFPETVVGMTLYWPMQRFYILIAAAAVVCGQRLLREFPATGAIGRDSVRLGLLVATLWSAKEAGKFIEMARRQSDTVLDSRRWSRLENVAVQRHTYGLFPRRPAYFTHGVVEPRLESRLLDPTTGSLLISDYDQGRAKAPQEDFRGTIDVNPGILDLDPPLTLRPGEQYLLTFGFARRDTAGLLQIIGPTLYREYSLPRSGELKSFGSERESEKSITIWTSAPGSETVRLRFIPTAEQAKPSDYIPFARYRLQKIDEQALPVRVSSLIPYRATVRSPGAALLETPRMFVPGYAATVNGAAAAVRRSAEGLVAFPVPQGESQVELRFAGPLALHLAFWLSAVGWIVAALWTAARATGLGSKPPKAAHPELSSNFPRETQGGQG